MLRALAIQPATPARIGRLASAGLSAGIAGYSGLVLVGGPGGRALPSAEALFAGTVLAAIALGVSGQSRGDRPSSAATASILSSLPFLLFAAALHISPSLAHFTTQTSALGWVLLSALVLAQAAAYRHATGVDSMTDSGSRRPPIRRGALGRRSAGSVIGLGPASDRYAGAQPGTGADLPWASRPRHEVAGRGDGDLERRLPQGHWRPGLRRRGPR